MHFIAGRLSDLPAADPRWSTRWQLEPKIMDADRWTDQLGCEHLHQLVLQSASDEGFYFSMRLIFTMFSLRIMGDAKKIFVIRLLLLFRSL
jgi:hypothetical protein